MSVFLNDGSTIQSINDMSQSLHRTTAFYPYDQLRRCVEFVIISICIALSQGFTDAHRSTPTGASQ